ncbi:MAG: DHH family phosphoesterase, partial [Candidatus Methanomethylophilus sp.]|nr:DHH family phosphoesterase [Methanomethylophilus sp.]
MDDSVLPSKLLTDLTLAAEIIRGHDFIHIYSHFDTDGLTAAGIAAKALVRAGKEFIVTIFPTLTESQMQVIEEAEDECVLVTDLGASYVKRFDAMKQDVVILDHHTVGDLATRVCYANPHLYGIDGMTSGCGASMSFLFAITLDEKNWDLAPLSIIGM